MRSKLRLFLALLPVSIMLTQCKSVDFTFLGLFNAKYNSEKPPAAQQEPSAKNSATLQDSGLVLSGVITDSLNKPCPGVELFIIKETTVEYHALTDSGGNYSIGDVNPDTYNFFLGVAPGKNNRKKEINNVKFKKENNHINLIF